MPRTLAAALRPYVSFRSRTRGEGYARQGRVAIVHSNPTSVSARVRGSMLYEASLDIAGTTLQPWCECPFFEGAGEPCKHVWALALVADRQHLLAVPPDLELEGAGIAFPALDAPYGAPPRLAAGHPQRTRAAAIPAWEAFLASLPPPAGATATMAGPSAELLYVFDPLRSTTTPGMFVELLRRQRRKNGEWATPRDVFLPRSEVKALPDQDDREILERVCGAADAWTGAWNIAGAVPVPSPFVLTSALQRDLIERMCATGRLMLRPIATEGSARTLVPIRWTPAIATFRLSIDGSADAGYTVSGVIDHQGEERPLHDAMFVTGALVLWRPADDEVPTFAPFDAAGADRWLAALINAETVHVPPAGATRLLTALATADLPHVSCPDDLRVETRVAPPLPIARVVRRKARGLAAWTQERLGIEVSFAYGPREVPSHAATPVLFDTQARVAWRRDPAAERSALARLVDLGVRPLATGVDGDEPTGANAGTHFDLVASTLPGVVRGLIADGWRVEADGRAYRAAATSTLGVRSGIDWFELHGALDFGGVEAPLPAVLAAARKGEAFVRLGDGSLGLLPDEWLSRSLRIAALGEPHEDHVRFQPAQAALVDAWLAEQPQVTWDEPFARLRDELAHFTGVLPEPPPASFTGALRGYQQDALGWFTFLRRFGFGGCLADEMGLGKTVMVLAALEARRLHHEGNGTGARPSLIVVPRSLVFNWQQEAARFAPRLRMLDVTGSQRRQGFGQIADHDVAIVTYGTLRRDIEHLKDVSFDYVILDEAQAIKNASTAAARAARLLRGRHRLALSGTPVENHLGELWSLFEFLNPGLLGSASAFTGARAVSDPADDDGMLPLIERGLRPFILRRTKEQVASELPARTEQTLYCDLGPAQRKVYDSLRAHYRTSLLGSGTRDEGGRSTIHVLEALLRLRQAACHPGLIDPAQAAGPSAKLDVLLPRLQELVEDGRKVLVFSQFTSLLALLRDRLDASGLTYEYLDGRTRNREARVRQFQEGPCPLFLISLKAGGLGLNLTAADYVFLLDPWWNPAVEAQAIDRAHRIGQTRAVFAYRLIARDTVEEKVLALQAGKRQLADAVVRADASVLRDLRREDLDLLLS